MQGRRGEGREQRRTAESGFHPQRDAARREAMQGRQEERRQGGQQ